MEKRYFIKQGLRNNPKNKLDELLQNEFHNLCGHLVPESKLERFKELHDELNARYKHGGGRCQPIEYRDSRFNLNRTGDKDISIYISETFWLNLLLINEVDVL